MKTEVENIFRTYRTAFIVIVLVALLGYALWVGYGGSLRVSTKLVEISKTAQEHERRADAVVDAAKQKEEVIAHEIAGLLETVSDDALPGMLTSLLAEYRAGRR